MFKATKLSASLALCFVALSSAQAGTLPDAIEKAVLRNPEVLARLHNYQASDAERDVARGGLFPRIDLQGYTGRERRDTPIRPVSTYNRPGYQLQLRQLIFDGFATQSDIKRLGYARAVRYFELLGTTDEIAYEASRAYLDVLRYRELAKLAQENWAIHKETVDQIERRVKAGVGRRVDLEQAFGRLALAQSNWLTESSNLHDVSQRYQRVVGEAPLDSLQAPPTFTDKLPAEKAAEWGLIWECTEDADFATRVDALARQLATLPTKALVRTRQAMHAAPGHTLEQQLSFEGGFMRELGWSPDYAEGVQAFMEKRAPNFTGE